MGVGIDRDGPIGALHVGGLLAAAGPPHIDEAGCGRKRGVPAGAVVLVVGHAPVVGGVDHFRGQLDIQPAGERLVEVESERLLVVEGVVDDAAVVLDQARGEVAAGLATTTEGDAGFVGKRGVPHQVPLVIEDLSPSGGEIRPPVRAVDGSGLCRAPEDSRPHPGRRGHLGRAEALADSEPRGTGPALLGGDDDHPVGRLGPVDSRRRRPFQHLDAVDVVGIEVGDSVHGVVRISSRAVAGGCVSQAAVAAIDRVVRDDHTVHHIERGECADDRRHAP